MVKKDYDPKNFNSNDGSYIIYLDEWNEFFSFTEKNLEEIKKEINNIKDEKLINNNNEMVFLQQILGDKVFHSFFNIDIDGFYEWISEESNNFQYLDINKIINFINNQSEKNSNDTEENINNYNKFKNTLSPIYKENINKTELLELIKPIEKEKFLKRYPYTLTYIISLINVTLIPVYSIQGGSKIVLIIMQMLGILTFLTFYKEVNNMQDKDEKKIKIIKYNDSIMIGNNFIVEKENRYKVLKNLYDKIKIDKDTKMNINDKEKIKEEFAQFKYNLILNEYFDFRKTTINKYIVEE